MSDLAQALLAAVPEDGGSIGNQALYERLKSQFTGLSEEQFWESRDALIGEGVLVKGRGRGGAPCCAPRPQVPAWRRRR